jgi:nitrilase
VTPVKVAAVQAAPVLLDRDATIDRVESWAARSAGEGANLVVFPEAFVPGYPDWVWRTRPWDQSARQLHARLLDQAVVAGSQSAARLGAIAREFGIWLVVGVDERDDRGSTIYNSLWYFAPEGTLAGRHRKLMPTGGERLVWGQGDGSTLVGYETGFGRIGGLICWENYMPLARAALYTEGIDIWVAPTWDNSDTWVATMRHIAKEGRMYVIGVNSCIRATDLPTSLPAREELWGGRDDWLSRGNTLIVDPVGEILAGPLIEEEGVVYANADLSHARATRLEFDPVGHYSRPDVLQLVVNGTARSAVMVEDTSDTVDGSTGRAGPDSSAERRT